MHAIAKRASSMLRFQVGRARVARSRGTANRSRCERSATRHSRTSTVCSAASPPRSTPCSTRNRRRQRAVVHGVASLERLETRSRVAGFGQGLAGVEIELREVGLDAESLSRASRSGSRHVSNGSTRGWRSSARSLGAIRVEEHRATRHVGHARRRLADLDGGAETIEDLARARSKPRALAYVKRATQLSAARRKNAATLGRAVTEQLVELGMADGEFRVELTDQPEERAHATGLERVESPKCGSTRVSRSAHSSESLRAASCRASALLSRSCYLAPRRVADLRLRRGRCRRRRPRCGDRRTQAEPARRQPAGRLRHAPASGREPGTAALSGNQAHRRQAQPHERARSRLGRACRGAVANARRYRDHGTNSRARRRDDRAREAVSAKK